jgi:hypothetical protein
MTTIRSAVDLVTDLPAGRALAAFACGCAQRAAALWTTAEDPRLAALLRDALAAAWQGAETGERPAPELVPGLLDEFDEDTDFGDFHGQRMDALVTVAHAVAAAVALGDDAEVLRKATAAAKAEINIVKGLFAERNGTWTGAVEHVSVARELSWQRDDLADLTADGSPGRFQVIRGRAAVAGTLLRAGVLKDDWSGRLPGPDEPALF